MQESRQVAPSILGADFGHLAEEVASITAGGADFLHVDIPDTVAVVSRACTEILVAGAAIFDDVDRRGTIGRLRTAALRP